MPREYSIDGCSAEFRGAMLSAANLAAAVYRYCDFTIDGMLDEPLHPTQARRVVALALLGLQSAFEEFVEQTFVRYLAGGRTDSFAPELRVGPCNSLEHAYQVIAGKSDFDPERGHISWSNSSEIVRRASVYFKGGEPYASALGKHKDLLEDVMIVRNRIAHGSTKCRAQFKRVALKWLALRPQAPLPPGFTPGNLLVDAPKVRALELFGKERMFECLLGMYNDLLRTIAPNQKIQEIEDRSRGYPA